MTGIRMTDLLTMCKHRLSDRAQNLCSEDAVAKLVTSYAGNAIDLGMVHAGQESRPWRRSCLSPNRPPEPIMILLLGATGYFGRAFASELRRRRSNYIPLSRQAFD